MRWPWGARGEFGNTRIFIDVDAAVADGTEFLPETELPQRVDQGKPQRLAERVEIWKAAQAKEREILFREHIPASAVEGTGTHALRTLGKGLFLYGVAVTTYELTSAGVESTRKGTPAPLAAEVIRQGGSWGGAFAGAGALAASAALAGVELGPAGVILFGLVGGLIGGTLGYMGSDWLADYVHEN